MDIQRRYRQHIAKILSGKHHSAKLQDDFKLYGRSAFRFSVVEVLSGEDATNLRIREQYYIDKYQTWDCGYNERRIAGGPEPSRETLIVNRYEDMIRKTEPDAPIPPSEKSILEWQRAVQEEEKSNNRIKIIVFCASLALMFFGYVGIFIGILGFVISSLLPGKSNLPKPEPVTPPLDGKVRMMLAKQISIERHMTIDAAIAHVEYCILAISKRRSDSEKWKRINFRRGRIKYSIRDIPEDYGRIDINSTVRPGVLQTNTSLSQHIELNLDEETVTYGPI